MEPATLNLLHQADAGDVMALDALFGREKNRLRRLLALRAGPALLAKVDLDDLVQEAYVEALRQIGSYSYQGKDSFFRWLATIGLNRLQNVRRMESAQKRDANREVRIGSTESVALGGGVSDVAAPGPGPKTLASGTDEAARLESALAQLGEQDREVILLARFEGLAIAEVADRIGRTKNATALLLSRALRKLRRALGGGSDT